MKKNEKNTTIYVEDTIVMCYDIRKNERVAGNENRESRIHYFKE